MANDGIGLHTQIDGVSIGVLCRVDRCWLGPVAIHRDPGVSFGWESALGNLVPRRLGQAIRWYSIWRKTGIRQIKCLDQIPYWSGIVCSERPVLDQFTCLFLPRASAAGDFPVRINLWQLKLSAVGVVNKNKTVAVRRSNLSVHWLWGWSGDQKTGLIIPDHWKMTDNW